MQICRHLQIYNFIVNLDTLLWFSPGPKILGAQEKSTTRVPENVGLRKFFEAADQAEGTGENNPAKLAQASQASRCACSPVSLYLSLLCRYT